MNCLNCSYVFFADKALLPPCRLRSHLQEAGRRQSRPREEEAGLFVILRSRIFPVRIRTDTSKTASTTLTCIQTGYGFSNTPSSYFDDSNFYSMIFGTGTYFWLASRCVDCLSYSSIAYFGLRYVYYNDLSGSYLFDSCNGSSDNRCRLASVVSLGSGIQVKSGSGTTSDPYIIGK